ncbi:MAG: hypothetical protein WA096_01460 [Smithella sp.]|jgi:hypothetical protein
MIAQTATIDITYNIIPDSSGLPSTDEDYVSQPELYKINVEALPIDKKNNLDPDDLSVLKNNGSDSNDTAYTRYNKAQYSFSVLQEWEGYVVSISKDTFTARLVDVTRNRSLEEEEVDLPLDDLEDADRRRISPGAIFRWVIGYNRSPGGTKDRASRIKLRDMPFWTKKEIANNRHEAAEWASQLNVE